MADETTTAFMHSRTGAVFMGQIDRESDGSVTILSNDGKGYRSAHRAQARIELGTGNLWCMNRLTWINMHGVRVVMTRWNTQAFRTDTH